jgi:lysine/ornithine N-monooxygenase
VRIYDQIGGTNTAYRRSWQQQLRDGRDGGWYRSVSGTVNDLEQLADDRLLVKVQHTDGITAEVAVDYVIDCTGLDGEVDSHALLADLLMHTNAGRNPIGRLDVSRAFEVRGTGSGDGQIYASGAPTLGGYFPGVDTFLGLQVAAQEIQENLADRGFGRRIGPMRSLRQWARWVANRPA